MQMPNLIQFEWLKDSLGFECREIDTSELESRATDAGATRFKASMLHHLADEGQGHLFIAPRGGKHVRSEPHKEHPAVFKEFADWDLSKVGAETLASRIGPLGILKPGLESTGAQWSLPITFEPLREWREAAVEMKAAVTAWEIGKTTGNMDTVIDLVNSRAKESGTTFGIPPAGHHIRPDVKLAKSTDARRPALFLTPNSLLEFMWLQFAQAVSADVQLQRCAECPTWYPFGTGTGRRKSALYCSDKCRKAASRRRGKAVS